MNRSTSDDDFATDPTGVRELLRNLPEPERMPAHVQDRISASLRAEQQRASADRPAAQQDGQQPPEQLTCMAPVTQLEQHRRRRIHPLLVAAASVAAFVGLAGVVTSQVWSNDYDVSAIYGGTEPAINSPADDGEFADAAQPSLSSTANEGAGSIRYGLATSSDVAGADFAQDLIALVPQAEYLELSAEQFPTQAERLSCVSATGEGYDSGQWDLIRTELDGQDAIVTIRTATDGNAQAWAFAPGCLDGETNPELLAEQSTLGDLR